MAETYDVAVIGAGVFGAWTAHALRNSGKTVALLDAYGAGNGRASSSGESRLLRMGYGENELYTRYAIRSRRLWLELFENSGETGLFAETGLLWTAPAGDATTEATRRTLRKCGVPFEALNASELASRWPQFHFASEQTATFEPQALSILARRSVRAVVEHAVRNGVDYFREAALTPAGRELKTASGRALHAGSAIYCCGPWLPKVFPEVVGGRIRSTRQEVFFFGCAAGDRSFTPAELPVWLDFSDRRGPYAFPDLENRGFKIGFDRHGPPFDPDTEDRTVAGIPEIRAFLTERFPAMAGAPLIDSRVCQYECTSSGDFLIDGHPEFKNVWLAGGGSGHGFKHGPAVGEYISQLLDGTVTPETRFSLLSKAIEPQRAVY